MRYHGFAAIDYLLLNNISLNKNSYVLEIGVGTGSTANLIISGKDTGKIYEQTCG